MLHSWKRRLGAYMLVAVVYVFAAKLGLQFAFVQANATAVWPPTGIALAALLVLGLDMWPGVLVGAFLANVLTSGGPLVGACIALGNTAEAVLGAYLVTRFAGGTQAFIRVASFTRFVLIALLSAAVSATIGTLSLFSFGLTDVPLSVWFIWWLGDVAGAIVVAPVIVLWAQSSVARLSRQQWFEVLILTLVIFVACVLVFGGIIPSELSHYPLEFFCLPCLLWVAIRFGNRATALAVCEASAFALYGTLQGYGPFVRGGVSNESVLILQMFVVNIAITGQLVAALAAERDMWELKKRQDCLARFHCVK